jgi:uncharacterized protein YbgA (DUF1722 family)/uncharacterized protein YbbK (DUF523 family)
MRHGIENNDGGLTPVRVGISRCLLGERVRYDGGHKHDHFLTDTLGKYLEWVPVCPEVEVGMGTPREPIQLVQIGTSIQLLGTSSGTDHTHDMRRYARKRCAQLAALDLCGYILKKDSPSCGMERVRVHHNRGRVTKSGRGLFAEVLIEQFPNLPIEEEGRLCDPRLRENWIERVFIYWRLRLFWASRWKVADLVRLHSALKLTLLAHSPDAYRELGRLVASAKSQSRDSLRGRYEQECMAALEKLATRGRHANVLQHIAGYFQDKLDDASRRELRAHIEDYRRGFVPILVPLTLISHYVRVFDIEYLKSQVYLNPHPKELALRNHV